ncbi:hypothetical protein [Flavobacterium macrobrachii]|uniref:LVIVD repeat-containing protein n=1 Tax=Flavobacterium macrobrachii TaxID=591204 RepID=A0ABS2CYP5_9FLAO|nr:hypothetical protein [Flavobacterium macrobrachii]MBM6500089.1 hypothetical protein [Flavobacterium macrobrachii]PZO29596.1 MAG: hypothetical protein DCF13_05650 [Flavobacteriaceae bacterium]
MTIKNYSTLLLVYYLFSSCFGFGEVDSRSSFKPVYMKRSDFENSIKFEAPKSILKSGKIYIKDEIMYLNDVNKGFQIYNYSNPNNPVKIGYINIPGATDVAIRNNILYVNQATDLVTINYNTSANSVTVTNRIKNAFPPKVSPDGFMAKEKQNQVVIDWTNSN